MLHADGMADFVRQHALELVDDRARIVPVVAEAISNILIPRRYAADINFPEFHDIAHEILREIVRVTRLKLFEMR